MAYSSPEKESVWDESKNELSRNEGSFMGVVLKTIIPSRKMKKRYLGAKRRDR
jgi:hypothetical protein